MNRYNVFNLAHKGLRAMLYDTAMLVQHTDFWNVEEAEVTLKRLEEAIVLFENHAHNEDNFVFPAVSKFEPAVTESFEQEHVKDHLLGSMLEGAISQYRAAGIISEKAKTGQMIRSAFSRFLIFNIEHMAREEDIINPILWRYYTDREIAGFTKRILESLSPAMHELYNRWIIRGLQTAEISSWLMRVEKTAPAEFEALLNQVKEELSGPAFRKVLAGISPNMEVNQVTLN